VLNAYGAGAMAEAGMFPETADVGSTPHWKILEAKYKDWMDKLENGKIDPYLV